MASPLRVVLDTDTYNEIDDQFALAHLLLSPKQVSLEAVYAAPFLNKRCSGPADGMEKSYEEILRVLELVKTPKPPKVFRGSTRYMAGAKKPVESAAVADLIERAMATKAGEKLHVLGIAVSTNLASALLIEPRIAKKIVLVWLGGQNPEIGRRADEFNLEQDVHAARILLEAQAPLILVPCAGVSSHIVTSIAELAVELEPFGKLGAYLTKIVRQYRISDGNPPAWSKVIWDIAVSAWAVNPSWLQADQVPSPVLRGTWPGKLTWGDPKGRRKISVIRYLSRDAILADFFAKAKKMG